MNNKIYRPDYTTASDARIVRTREALRSAMLKLLDQKPFEQITIRDLATQAGIGYTTFFRHHPTKESLLDEIAATEIRELIDFMLNAFGTTDTRSASRALCDFVQQHRKLWTTLLTGGAASTLRNEFIRIARLVSEHTPRANEWLPADFGVVLVASGTMELLAWWLGAENPEPAENIATIYERAILAPIFPPASGHSGL